MRVRLKVAPPPDTVLSFFQVPRRFPSISSVTSSVMIHGVAAGALMLLPSNTEPRTLVIDRIPPLTLRLGEHLYYVTSLPKKLPSGAGKGLTKPAVAPVIAHTDVPRAPKTDFAMLQPTMIDQAPPTDVKLPSLRLVTSQLVLPKYQRDFVAPGTSRTVETVSDAQMLLPSQDVPAKLTPTMTRTPQLTLAPAPLDADSPQFIPSVEPAQIKGDPINLTVVSNNSAPIPEKLVVPPGRSVPAGTAEGPATSAPRNASLGPGIEGVAGGDGRGPSTSPSLPVRVLNRPRNGTFDAVVVQTAPLDQFPEARGLLTGRPIYSVYIAMETARDWTLFFAVPGVGAAQSTGPVVTLGNVVPVQAPYPVHMLRPELKVPAFYKSLLIFGSVDDKGKVEKVKMVKGASNDANQALLTSLSGWEFRPATRDGVPVRVEFLLVIPVAGL